MLGLVLIALLWAIGLVSFIGRLPAPATGAPGKSDGIVVYTGGAARISAGMELFAAGGGDRLLISGVHPGTSRARLEKLWTGAPELFDCCVDLGREARTTEGNAAEVGDWTNTHGFDSLTLVTSEYHMPRALTATRARLPETRIEPYAVASGYLDAEGRPASLKAWAKLAGEYAKLLLAQGKAFFVARGR